MVKAKVGKETKTLVEKAAELRDLQIAAIENQVYEAIQPEVKAHILSSIEKHAKNEQKLNELRSDLEDDIENPIPEDDDYLEDDTLDVERGSEAEMDNLEDSNIDTESDEFMETPPSSSDLDSGVSDVLKIEVDGVTFEAEYSPGDNKIVFLNPESPNSGEDMEGGDELDMSDDLESEDEFTGDSLEGEEDFDFEFDNDSQESEFKEDDEEDDFRLRKEIHNRIAKKSKAGVSKEDLLEEYRSLIRKRLMEELSTNIHETPKKQVRKVTVEERLASKNLVPKKYQNKEALNEQEQKQLKTRLAQLLNL